MILWLKSIENDRYTLENQVDGPLKNCICFHDPCWIKVFTVLQGNPHGQKAKKTRPERWFISSCLYSNW